MSNKLYAFWQCKFPNFRVGMGIQNSMKRMLDSKNLVLKYLTKKFKFCLML